MLAPISPKFRYIFWEGEESKEGRKKRREGWRGRRVSGEKEGKESERRERRKGGEEEGRVRGEGEVVERKLRIVVVLFNRTTSEG